MKQALAALIALTMAFTTARAGTTWTGNGDGQDWFDGGNWDSGMPGPGDDVVIGSGSVLLTNQTDALGSLTLSAGTLTFSNWTTRLSATNVAIAGGTVTLPPPFANDQMSNRVWFACSNLLLAAGAKIDVAGMGFARGVTIGNGPGGGIDMGAANHYDCGGGGHGGLGGRWFRSGTNGLTYGSVSNPTAPGSGGCPSDGRDGGGAVRIEATGHVIVNGQILADGGSAGAYASAGSGGSVWIDCHTFAATGAVINAAGGHANTVNSSGGGGGGRIAITYDPTAQSNMPAATLTCSVRGGRGTANTASGRGDRYTKYIGASGEGDLGTLYFPDTQLLTENIAHSGTWIVPGFTSWAPDNLTLNGGWFRFPSRFVLSVTNDLTVLGTYGRFDVTNANVSCGGALTLNQGDMVFNSESATGLSLQCGSLMVTNGGELHVYAGCTNAGTPDYGALVQVDAGVAIATNSVVYPWSQATNGGSVLFRVADITVAAGGVINADTCGFMGQGPGEGFGPGRGLYSSLTRLGGGGYGGNGGGYSSFYGVMYGDSNAPVEPGSSGAGSGSSYPGGAGGGLVWIEASGTIELNGLITANGGTVGAYGGCGSGGGVYLFARDMAGTNGTIRANGGSGGTNNGRAGGGGGRIAVWSAYDLYQGVCAIEVLGGVAQYTGEVGTVVWGDLAPTISTEAAVNIAGTTASVVGDLVSTGQAATVVYVAWGQTNGVTVKGDWATHSYLGTNGVGRLTNDLSGLVPATVYYYRFYASNGYGNVWADETKSFSTQGDPSIENTGGATDITPTSASLHGLVTGGNPTPTVTIYWGPTKGTNTAASWTNAIPVGLATNPVLIAPVAGMIANKTYYYTCYATNLYGDAWSSSVTNFTTLGPTVTIDNVDVVEGATATTTAAVFTVSLSATSLLDVAVDFASANDTTAAGDLDATNGTLTIAAGLTNGTITVVVNGDAEDEYPSEQFFVNLSSPSNATLADAQGRGTIVDDDDVNQVRAWTGIGDWNSATNWSPAGIPGPADDAILTSGSSTLSNPVHIASLTVNGGALIFTNWSTKVTATTVILNGGTVTLPGPFTDTQMSNRVWFACSNLTVASGGKIDVSSMGYCRGSTLGYGPGGGINMGNTTDHSDCGGGGHGGLGGRWFRSGTNGLTYGSVTNPTTAGSGGCNTEGRDGGGVVRIDATGTVVVNGTITADGGSAGAYAAGGAGGSVWITCGAIAGTNGWVSAAGGNANTVNASGGGGGGRISVVYSPAVQSGMPVVDVTFSARGGRGTAYNASGRGDRYTKYIGASGYGDLGTLYFPDSELLQEHIQHSGSWSVPGFTSWSPNEMTVDGAWFRFPSAFTLSVANGLSVLGSYGRFDATNSSVSCGGKLLIDQGSVVFNAETAVGLSLQCGSVMVTNGGELHVYGGYTNAGTSDYGTLLNVADDVVIASGSAIYPWSEGTNGGSVLIRARNVSIDPGGTINADQTGFRSGVSDHGSGPGRGRYVGLSDNGGGGYGGLGGHYALPYGQTYGSSNAPVHAGSGGAGPSTTQPGGAGGGLVRIEASATLLLNGLITANGGSVGAYGGCGAGGGVYLHARYFAGTNGVIEANGGTTIPGSNGRSGGGGGRIAVWSMYNQYQGVCTTEVAGGDGVYVGEDGTVVWGYIPAEGSVFLLR